MENNWLKYLNSKQYQEIKNIDDVVIKATLIIFIVFKDILDKSGKPYIGHLLRVARKFKTNELVSAALLHDIIQDTSITAQDLLDIGFSIEVVEIVKMVTKEPFNSKKLTQEQRLNLYEREINDIINSGNEKAILLKEADMSDNYNPNRIETLSQEEQEWFDKKYAPQLLKLRREKSIIEKRNKYVRY